MSVNPTQRTFNVAKPSVDYSNHSCRKLECRQTLAAATLGSSACLGMHENEARGVQLVVNFCLLFDVIILVVLQIV